MNEIHDAIIVGGGHNGLTAAAGYLAKAGRLKSHLNVCETESPSPASGPGKAKRMIKSWTKKCLLKPSPCHC